MNRVIKALGVSKSTVYYKSKAYPKNRKSSFTKVLDLETKHAILTITKHRATYGIPRVKALLERDYGKSVTKYALHKFMEAHNLLIKKGRKRGASRPHTGVIAVSESNKRWASDITSIKCWNGEKLRFAFIIDCCDRSIIAWKAAKHIQACDIELMVQNAIYERFKNHKAPNNLQFLHDNGPEYIEKTLQQQLKEWGIEDCRTPTYSPQSNGICEAFNGTFKRDYVYQNCLETPQNVSKQIQHWIQDYNKCAPHSALNMKAPNEYYKCKLTA